jgi:hypothetical protein
MASLLVRRGGHVAGLARLSEAWMQRLMPQLMSLHGGQKLVNRRRHRLKHSTTPQMKLLSKKQERLPMTGMSCGGLPHLAKHTDSALPCGVTGQ